jgi:hypothetical protein
MEFTREGEAPSEPGPSGGSDGALPSQIPIVIHWELRFCERNACRKNGRSLSETRH